MVKSLSIFSSEHLPVIRDTFAKGNCRLALHLFLIFGIAFLTFDRVDLVVLVLIEMLLIGIAYLKLAQQRKHIVLFSFITLFALALVETIFRIDNFGTAGLQFTAYSPAAYGNPFSNFIVDENTYTGLKPNTKIIFKGAPFNTNSKGFRGRDYPYEKPPNSYRIVLLGSSASVGTGVSEQYIFSSLLEEKFSQSLSMPTEVINLSIPGSDLGNRLHTLEHEGLLYNPDMILFMFKERTPNSKPLGIKHRKVKQYQLPTWQIVNDHEFHFFRSCLFIAHNLTQVRRQGILDFSFLQSISYLRHEIPKHEVDLATANDNKLHIVYSRFIEGLDKLRQLTKERSVVLYYLKSVNPQQNLRQEELFIEYVRRQARQRNMAVIDTLNLDFSPFRQADRMIYPGDFHPSVIIHKQYATALHRKIKAIISSTRAQSMSDNPANVLFPQSKYLDSPENLKSNRQRTNLNNS